MSTETTHVERRAGQRWRSSDVLGGKPYIIEGTLARREDFGGNLGPGWRIIGATKNGESRDDGEYVFYDLNWDDRGRAMALVADAPPAAPKVDRAACKAWCGMRQDASRDYGRMAAEGWPEVNGPGGEADRWWCSPGCVKALVPPLESKPAELAIPGLMKKPAETVKRSRIIACGHGMPSDECNWCDTVREVIAAPPAPEAPKAIGPVDQPRCTWSHVSACAGPIELRHVSQGLLSPQMRWCEGHYLESERRAFGGGTGTPYTGPERLPRPQLAADWVEDCLPESWR